jgi:hypothetical protein
MEKELMQETTRKSISAIQDDVHLAQRRARTDANYYALAQEAEANKVLLTEAYLEYANILSLGNNTKVYFGDKIPNLFVDKARK